jgi:hypothetical protein
MFVVSVIFWPFPPTLAKPKEAMQPVKSTGASLPVLGFVGPLSVTLRFSEAPAYKFTNASLRIKGFTSSRRRCKKWHERSYDHQPRDY